MKTHEALIFSGLCAIAAGCGTATTESIPSDAGADGGPVVILNGGGEIEQPPDGATVCPQGACNYQTNAGCSAAQTCAPSSSNGTVSPVCTAAGAGASGAACKSAAECAPGHLCTSPNGGVCRKLCCGGDWAGCAANESCIQNISLKDASGTAAPTGAMFCLPVNTCDALDPSSCAGAGETCQIVDSRGSTACLKEGAGDSGEACPCKGGFLCVKDECRRLCKAVEGGGEPYCQEGEGICVHYNRDPAGVGECTPKENL